MSEETAVAFDAALATYTGPGDRDTLTSAARAHVDASPPLDDLLAEYQRAHGAWQDSGRTSDYGPVEVAAAVMVPVRQAAAVLAGRFPDSAPEVTADEVVTGAGEGA